MENQKSQAFLQSYHEQLNALIYSPKLTTLSNFFSSNSSPFAEPSFNPDSSFLGRVEWDIMAAKRKILKQLLAVYRALKPKQLQELQMKMRGLISSPQKILRDGIIGIYSDIGLLRETSCGQASKEFVGLLGQIVLALEPLLRDYFIFKQMEKKDHMLAGGSLSMILSEKKISCPSDSLASINSTHSIKQLISDRALREVTQNIQLKSIKQLVEEQLKINEIQEIKETCRICRNHFEVSVLQKHVQFCSKLQAENSKRQEIVANQLLMVQKMKEETAKQKGVSEQEAQIYRKIIMQLEQPINSLKKPAEGLKPNFQFPTSLIDQIESYLKNTKAANNLLANFQLQARERLEIENKIALLQANYINLEKQKPASKKKRCLNQNGKIRSSQNCKTRKHESIRTKKSLFARKEQSEESNWDSGTGEFTTCQINKFHSIKAHMEQIFGSCSESDFEDRIKLHKSLSNFSKKEEEEEEEKSNQVSIKDFEILKFLGKGAFGKVYLVRRKKTGDIYALKVIKIQQNWDQKQLASLKNEHQILSQIAGEYLVKAVFSFSEGQAHFFVLEYMPGGDLAKVLQQQVYLDYIQSRFYLAEIVLALERLHEMGIIHRDLKPENLIFDEVGHLKLTDFGLSQIRINDKIRKAKRSSLSNSEQIEKQKEISQMEEKSPQRAQTSMLGGKRKVKLIGTPDYIAPEIISGESLDNLSIDWWSLGVIAYQMMIGCRPFCANTVDEVISNIQHHQIQWPAIGEQENEISPIAADLIQKLLNSNYSERLGSKNIQQIKQHPFFQGIDWKSIKTIKPPLTPAVDGIENYDYAVEVPELRQEIKSMIGNYKAKSSFKLDNFVRYDILVEETLSSAGKQIVKRSTKIKKLKSIASNFGSSNGQSKDEERYFEDQSLDQEKQKGWSHFRDH